MVLMYSTHCNFAHEDSAIDVRLLGSVIGRTG